MLSHHVCGRGLVDLFAILFAMWDAHRQLFHAIFFVYI